MSYLCCWYLFFLLGNQSFIFKRKSTNAPLLLLLLQFVSENYMIVHLCSLMFRGTMQNIDSLLKIELASTFVLRLHFLTFYSALLCTTIVFVFLLDNAAL